MLSRTKPAVGPGSGNTVSSAKESKKKRKLPKLEDFLQARDYTGAITFLEVHEEDVCFSCLSGNDCLSFLRRNVYMQIFRRVIQIFLMFSP